MLAPTRPTRYPAAMTTTKPRARYTRLSSEDRRAALIEAALSCIADGGIQAFTVDRIIDRAGVSRGLITHHFGSMNALLAAVYAHIYATAVPTQNDMPSDRPLIQSLLDHLFSPVNFNREALNIWLSLWGEISNNPDLKAEHRAQYHGYHAMIATALAAATTQPVDADGLARSLICLVDGLGLQHCIDPELDARRTGPSGLRRPAHPSSGTNHMITRTEFPYEVRVVESLPIPLPDGTILSAKAWMPDDRHQSPRRAGIPALPQTRRHPHPRSGHAHVSGRPRLCLHPARHPWHG